MTPKPETMNTGRAAAAAMGGTKTTQMTYTKEQKAENAARASMAEKAAAGAKLTDALVPLSPRAAAGTPGAAAPAPKPKTGSDAAAAAGAAAENARAQEAARKANEEADRLAREQLGDEGEEEAAPEGEAAAEEGADDAEGEAAPAGEYAPAANIAEAFDPNRMVKYGSDILKTGDLAPEDRAALKKIGVPDQVIDGQVLALKSLRERNVYAAMSAVGGDGAWNIRAQWANDNLPAADRARIFAGLQSPNVEDARAAGRMLDDAFRARGPGGAAGARPRQRLTHASDQGSKAPEQYADFSELMRDKMKPLARDFKSAEGKAERERIYKKLLNSPKLHVQHRK